MPRTIWSALRGSTPNRMDTSTVGSNFVVAVSLTSRVAASGAYSVPWSILAAEARYALLRFMLLLLCS